MRRLTLVALGVVGALAALANSQITDWGVMTDELLYAKLATAAWDGATLLPVLHGERVGFLAMIYPLLIAPFYGTLGAVDAYQASLMWNAVLMSSAGIPAYLLARMVLPLAWAWVASLLAVVTPWLVLSAFLWTEPAAYPVFLWTMVGCCRACAQPSARNDALAAGMLAVAFLTRTQFLVLAAALPVAVALYELGWGGRWTDALRRVLSRHRPLVAAYGLAAAVAVGLLATGGPGRVLGSYAVTATQGSLLPRDTWRAAALHVDQVAIGLGLLPFLLGVAWIFPAALRARPESARAFAALGAALLVLLPLEVGSFALRFGGNVVRDRYAFYLAPVLLIGALAFVLEDRRRSRGVLLATAFFAATVHWQAFPARDGVSPDSPGSLLNNFLRAASGPLSPGLLVSLCGIAIGSAAALAVARVPRRTAAPALAVALAAFGLATTTWAFAALLSSPSSAERAKTGSQGRVLDWVDRAVPEGARVAIAASPVAEEWSDSAVAWWDVEFWNRSVRDALVAPSGQWTYTSFPTHGLGETRPRYVVVAASDRRFLRAGDRIADSDGLALVALRR